MIIDSSIKTLLEERSKKISELVEFGLLIGQQSNISDETFVLGFFPSPHQLGDILNTNNNEDTTKTTISNGNLNLINLINKDWILEFCFQVYRMLYGGINIVGFYLIAPDSEILGDDEFFIKLLKFLDTNLIEPIKSIQFISYSLKTNLINGKLTNSTLNYRLKSTEIKIVNNLETEFLKFTCSLPIDIVLNSSSKNKVIRIEELKNQIRDTFRKLFKESLFLIDNEIVMDNNIIASTLNNNSFIIDILIRQLDNTFKIESESPLYFQFNSNTNFIAYVHKSEQVSTVYQYIKQDIIKSFQSRLDLVNDELSDGSNSNNSLKLSDLPMVLPRRVNIQWINNSITICDYLSNHDEINDCIERLSDLLQFDSPSTKIISFEINDKITKSSTSIAPSTTKVSNNSNNHNGDGNSNNNKNNINNNKSSNNKLSNKSLQPTKKDSKNNTLYLIIITVLVLILAYYFK